MTKQEAIQELLSWDHVVISAEAARPVCDAFGVPVPRERNHPDAYREDGKAVIGIAAHELAEYVCHCLNIDYISQFGRGSQLRMCCKALQESLLSPKPQEND